MRRADILLKVSHASQLSVERSGVTVDEFWVEDEGSCYEPFREETYRRNESSRLSYKPLECQVNQDESNRDYSFLRKSVSFESDTNRINFEEDSRVGKMLLISTLENSAFKEKPSRQLQIANCEEVIITGMELKIESAISFSILAERRKYKQCYTVQVTKKITLPKSTKNVKIGLSKFVNTKLTTEPKKPKFVPMKKKPVKTNLKTSLKIKQIEKIEEEQIPMLKEIKQTIFHSSHHKSASKWIKWLIFDAKKTRRNKQISEK